MLGRNIVYDSLGANEKVVVGLLCCTVGEFTPFADRCQTRLNVPLIFVDFPRKKTGCDRLYIGDVAASFPRRMSAHLRMWILCVCEEF